MEGHQTIHELSALAVVTGMAVVIDHERLLYPAAVAQHLHEGALAGALLADDEQ